MGASSALGGIFIYRRPMVATYEIIRQGGRDLHLISIGPALLELLLALAGCVSICEECYHGYEVFGHPYIVEEPCREGTG